MKKIYRLNNVAVIDNTYFPLGFVIMYNENTQQITISSIHYPYSATFLFTEVVDYQNKSFSSATRLLEYLAYVLNEDNRVHFKSAESIHTFIVMCNSASITYAVLAVRKRNISTCSAFIKSFGAVITASSDAGILKIVRNPTLTTGTLTYNPNQELEFAIGNGSQYVADGSGTIVYSGTVSQSWGFIECNLEILNNDQYVLCYRPITTTQSLAFLLNCQTDSTLL